MYQKLNPKKKLISSKDGGNVGLTQIKTKRDGHLLSLTPTALDSDTAGCRISST